MLNGPSETLAPWNRIEPSAYRGRHILKVAAQECEHLPAGLKNPENAYAPRHVGQWIIALRSDRSGHRDKANPRMVAPATSTLPVGPRSGGPKIRWAQDLRRT